MKAIALRAPVQVFAAAMERELLAHDDRSGWESESLTWLLERARQELVELEQVVNQFMVLEQSNNFDRGVENRLAAARRKVVGEAADVANFCMMVADNCEGLESQ